MRDSEHAGPVLQEHRLPCISPLSQVPNIREVL